MRRIWYVFVVIALVGNVTGCGTDAAGGTDGTDGTDAADGTDGTDAADGTDGTDAADGTDGTDAADGTDGTDAADGTTTGTTAEECAVACTVFKECVGEETEGECETNCVEQSDTPQAQVLLACAVEGTSCGAFNMCVLEAITPPGLFKGFNGSCDAICDHVTGCDPDKDGTACLTTCDNKLDQDWHNLNIDCIKNSSHCGEYIACMAAGGK
jgi:hypothetical protein